MEILDEFEDALQSPSNSPAKSTGSSPEKEFYDALQSPGNSPSKSPAKRALEYD